MVSTGGIAAMAGYLNCVALLPALAIFLALATYALIQRQKNGQWRFSGIHPPSRGRHND
jgi:hypothetical protein